jgi:VWFA-related protein
VVVFIVEEARSKLRERSNVRTVVRILLGVVIVSGLACAVAADTPTSLHLGPSSLRLAQPNTARFPAVTLYAYPTDARGVRIGGLRADSFQVIENGVPAEVTKVEAEGGSIDVCLALDRSPSMLDENKLAYAKAAAREFVGQLAAGDQAALITFSNGSSLDQGLTPERAPLLAAIDRTQATGTTTTFLDGVYWAITQVALLPQGAGSVTATSARRDSRRVVLALTDGNDRASRVLPQELIDYARANSVSLCMVALGGDASSLQMEHLARETGGVFLRAPSPRDLAALYVALAQQLRQEYRITFKSPRPAPDGTKRQVKVSLVSQPIAGEAWYQAPVQGSLAATGGTDAAVGSAATGAGGTGGARGQPLLVGVVLMVLGLTGVLVAVFYWLGTRNRSLNIVDSNPRLDLLPLWVREGSTRVGRGTECELVLDSRQVSRVHAIIEALDGAYRLLDEGSRNGTYVNGRRVQGLQELRIGDTVRFGDREFRFSGVLNT